MKPFQHAADEAEKMHRKFILDRMEELGWTVYRLSQETGIAKTTIHRFLDGETKASYNTILQLLGALKIRIYLIETEEDNAHMNRIYFN